MPGLIATMAEDGKEIARCIPHFFQVRFLIFFMLGAGQSFWDPVK
jgi:hypothetical protein